MTTQDHGWSTASLSSLPNLGKEGDPTPGLALIYSRLHSQLPSALAFAVEVTTIGREADNSLSLPEGAVSRYHARVERGDQGCVIVDTGSTNGTMVNGERVKSARLEPHDVVRIGDSLFRFVHAGIYNYAAYRVDGAIVEAARPIKHGIESPLLIGGYQIDLALDRITKVADTGLSVVIFGESGTGKELAARELHQRSGRPGPLQAINCAALPPNLIESELFGYKKGAFTGATNDKVGLIRAAHRGTLFLDEIGDMPLEAQAKLLRVLQERQVLPIGATTAEAVDVRVVSATHRDLDAFVADGRFRGDLLARLREAQVELVPLRERREDLFRLVRHFLSREGTSKGTVSFPFMVALAHYDFPYNVRELESAVKLAVALADGKDLDLGHLPETMQRALEGHGRPSMQPGATTSQQSMPPVPAAAAPPTEAELRALLTQYKGNIAAVGRVLGKERMQVHRWLKRFSIDVNDYRS